MTVLTLPAQPGYGTKPAPVPWRRMVWVTWRQHRGMLIGVTSVLAAVSVFLLIAGLKAHHAYPALVNCHPASSNACSALNRDFNSTYWPMGNTVDIFMNLAPALLGVFTGPAVLARELETGAFRYAWTQGIGRVRWTIAKLTLLAVLLTILAFVTGQLFAWFFAPFLTIKNIKLLSVGVFDTQGIAYAAWTLTAFCLGAFGGMLVRRVLPAIAATLGAYAALAAATLFYLRNHYPVSAFWSMQFFEAGWLLALCALLVAGTLWLVRRHAA